MAQFNAKLAIRPETAGKLSRDGQKLWCAAHKNDSGNKIITDSVIEASTYDVSIAAASAGFNWLKKLFKNRGKSREDIAAEKEATRINNTCTALEEELLEYIDAAKNGTVNEADLDELIETLDEMHGYEQAGKVAGAGRQELAEIRRSIEEFTAAITESLGVAPQTVAAGNDDFESIRNQLARQKELIE